MDVTSSKPIVSPYHLLFQSLSLIPISHYLLALLFLFLVFLYHTLEFHFLHDLFTGFRGDPVSLTYNASSDLCRFFVAKCRVLHERYLVTPWLSSPHLQTVFLGVIRPPPFSYTRKLFRTPDGGTIALDWLRHSDVIQGASYANDSCLRNDKIPIVIVIPGLTSHSNAAYIEHLAYKMANQGWNVVVSNHRGLGGISLTSDQLYNAGWTEDIRKVADHIHSLYPEAPLYAVGTSIGANILVKYLGEDGPDTPLVGAAAICSPWDLLMGDRFINRRPMQKFYNRVLAVGLQGYARLHQPVVSRIANWEGINKSRSVRDFDNHATRLIGKFETVDAYYRHSSCASFVKNVSVPLLCISALDDPVCTKEAIPVDECRANENIILAITNHGGHLAYHEGVTATSLWWVRAVGEFLSVLHSSPFIEKRKKIPASTSRAPLESSIDHGPYVNVVEDGMVKAASDGQTADDVDNISNEHLVQTLKNENSAVESERNDTLTQETESRKDAMLTSVQSIKDFVMPVKRSVDKLSRYSRKSIWLLAYIAIITSWPLFGPALLFSLKKRLRKHVPGTLFRR